MGTAADVRVGVTGVVYSVPVGTTLVTDVTTDLTIDVDYTDVGYISDEGVTQAIGEDSTPIRAWGGDEVRTINSTHTVTYQFTMIETSETTLAEYYGNYAAGVVQVKAQQIVRHPWVVDVVDGTENIRIVIPDGQVTERGDIVFQTEEAIGYQVTITAYPDDTDVKAYQYNTTES